MIDGTLVVVALGFLGTIGTIFWSEHRQTRMLNARIDELKTDYQREMAGFKTDYQKDMTELKAEMRIQDERHRILEGKVDRIQGSLDVLIHAYRHEPLAQSVEERQVSETTAD